MKIAIVGSRTITDYNFVEQHFLNLISDLDLKKENIMIVSGGARGVDTLAQLIAKKHGLPILIFYPDYNRFGRSAPFIRNVKIIENADYILAFPSKESRGTIHTIKEARRKGKPIKIIINS